MMREEYEEHKTAIYASTSKPVPRPENIDEASERIQRLIERISGGAEMIRGFTDRTIGSRPEKDSFVKDEEGFDGPALRRLHSSISSLERRTSELESEIGRLSEIA